MAKNKNKSSKRKITDIDSNDNKKRSLKKNDSASSFKIGKSHSLSITSTNSSVAFSSSSSTFPLPYPHASNLPLPKNDFLRRESPFEKSFDVALDTSYEGFVVDLPYTSCNITTTATNNNNNDIRYLVPHQLLQKAFQTMDQHHIFRTDVTQPFGLGTKCAKTYVTRCLVGERGTTYKYLGLRMFSYPWNENASSLTDTTSSLSSSSSSSSSPSSHNKISQHQSEQTMTIEEALNVLYNLNQTLTQRTGFHLNELNMKRKKRILGGSNHDNNSNNNNNKNCYIKGRAKFDVALINRMENYPDLKPEPTIGESKCSVSWHADSSLEHYSTIAVYHTIIDNHHDEPEKTNPKPIHNYSNKKNKHPNNKLNSNMDQNYCTQDNCDNRWYVALRVAHDSEGPNSSRRGTDIESSVVKDTPPIAVSLPSGSSYYLLDDFNHHHQHAVLVTDKNNKTSDTNTTRTTVGNTKTDAGVRYASTHRLLREGHNVNFILERCRSTCSQFHKKGPKIWRSEQLLLTEIESEWIRQFYIQGQGHKDHLWKYWKEPICKLLKYWSLLEERTKQVFDLLRLAAEEHCYADSNVNSSNRQDDTTLNVAPSRKLRKLKEKRKKSLIVVNELLQRRENDKSHKDQDDALNHLYIPFASLLDERSHVRNMWSKRENDHAFKTLSVEYKPIPVPFQFNTPQPEGLVKPVEGESNEEGFSPLDGSYKGLQDMSHSVKKYGKAFMSGKLSDLPVYLATDEGNNIIDDYAIESDKKRDDNNLDVIPALPLNSDDHMKPLTWDGWGDNTFGLEMQEPWGSKLLSGSKTIETRAYDLPTALIGKKIDIFQSKQSLDGLSKLDDIISGAEVNNHVTVIGWVIFEKVIIYRYKAKFEADEGKHLVKKGSVYGWNIDTKLIYGWVVGKCGYYNPSNRVPLINEISRRFRSLFEVKYAKATTNKGGKRKRSKHTNNGSSMQSCRKKKNRY